ncbi:corticosteroid- binding protein [Rhizophlyctis rosea]|uniref:Carboxypeptidase M14A n=1 Tax=Rhizophlyctis rosea TaxID=64517 RepID=A0AAD5SFU4_9FUNG|nr:corticosteroid- binding protein [Rhizophlyctis rosea]
MKKTLILTLGLLQLGSCFLIPPSLTDGALGRLRKQLNKYELYEVGPNRVRFDSHEVWRVNVVNDVQVKVLHSLEEVGDVDIWANSPTLHYMDIRVEPENVKSVRAAIDALSPAPSVSILIDDVQSLIEKENIKHALMDDDSDNQQVLGDSSSSKDYFTSYHKIEEIQHFYDSLQKQYPDLVKPVEVGKTYEGRVIKGIEIDATNGTKANVRDVVFHGGIHAREWIGPAVVTYMANELLSKYKEDNTVTDLLSKFRFVIIPVLNVDGYVYTHEKNRMWRKNRQPNSLPFCVGTDPNRNWGYKWGKGGSSTSPCSEAYQGPSAFSAPEAKAMADYLKRRAPNVVAYIDFHAYSQLWMSPFGADCNEYPKDNDKIQAAGNAAAKALKAVHGSSFAVGSICEIIYQASGSSVDWAYAEANVTYSYGVELRDRGKYGFILPADQIIPSGEETFAALVALTQYIAKDLQL